MITHADGLLEDEFRMDLVFISGTIKYKSTLGPRTIFTVDLPTTAIHEAAKNAIKDVAIPEQEPRMWTVVKEEPFKGRILDYDGAKKTIKLLKLGPVNNDVVMIPVVKLSKSDVAFVRNAIGVPILK